MANNRQHSPELRLEIVKRMLAGENVVGLSKQHGLARSMMYRWRDAYRRDGPEGLGGAVGKSGRLWPSSRGKPGESEQKLRQRIAELERKIGQQAVDLDFFKGVFKRLNASPTAPRRGGKASTPRSGK